MIWGYPHFWKPPCEWLWFCLLSWYARWLRKKMPQEVSCWLIAQNSCQFSSLFGYQGSKQEAERVYIFTLEKRKKKNLTPLAVKLRQVFHGLHQFCINSATRRNHCWIARGYPAFRIWAAPEGLSTTNSWWPRSSTRMWESLLIAQLGMD